MLVDVSCFALNFYSPETKLHTPFSAAYFEFHETGFRKGTSLIKRSPTSFDSKKKIGPTLFERWKHVHFKVSVLTFSFSIRRRKNNRLSRPAKDVRYINLYI